MQHICTCTHGTTFFLLLPPPVIIKEWLLHLMRVVVIHYLIIKISFPWDLGHYRDQTSEYLCMKRERERESMYLLILIDWYGTIISSSCEQLFMQREILYLFAILHYMYTYMYIRIMLAEKRDIKRQHARQGIPRRGACKAYKALKQEQGYCIRIFNSSTDSNPVQPCAFTIVFTNLLYST